MKYNAMVGVALSKADFGWRLGQTRRTLDIHALCGGQ